MGRPPKRRREETDCTKNDGVLSNRAEESSPLNGEPPGFTTNGLEAVDGRFAGNREEKNDLHFIGNGNGIPEFQIESVTAQSLRTPDLNSRVRFSSWDISQEPSTYLPMDIANPGLLPAPSLLSSDPTNPMPTDPGKRGCSCLVSLYSTLAGFQSLPAPSFPFSIGVLRKARQCAYEVVRCQKCPEEYNKAVQNVMLLCTLLQMLIHEYAKLLKYIDERSSSGEKIAFRVGEVSSCFDERHTGMPDCPMAINIDLDGDEWRMLARKPIRQEVMGIDGNDECLRNLIREMRTRQAAWHGRCSSSEHAHEDHNNDTSRYEQRGETCNDICTQILHIDQLQRMLDLLKI